MQIQETFTTALSALLANKLRSFLAVLGIVIGVSAVIILVALGTGLQTYITNQVSSLGSNLLYVFPGQIGVGAGPGDVVNRLTFEMSDELKRKLENVADVGPIVQKVTTLKYQSKESNQTTVLGG